RQCRMRHVAALRAFLDHDRKAEQFDDPPGHSGAQAEAALIAVGDYYRGTAKVGDSPRPEPRVARFVGEMLGHFELCVGLLEMTEQVEKEAGAAQFSVTIEAENHDLFLSGRHCTEFH